MKQFLITTIVALLLVGCGESQSPEPPKVKAPDISIHKAAKNGDIEVVKQHLASGEDVNAKLAGFGTPLDLAKGETADLLRKHGGKTAAELKAEGK